MLDTDPLSDVAERIRALATNLDGVNYTALVLGAGYGGSVKYAYASGVLSLYIAVSKATIAAGELVASGLPAAYRPTQGNVNFAVMNISTGAPYILALETDGEVRAVLATTAGLSGALSYVR